MDAAMAYEELFVPAIFAQWAGPLADAARIADGQRVLDVACGTGVAAREAAERVGAAGRVVGVDMNPGMLAAAKRIAPAVEWREGMAEALPLADESFDAVVSQFGLMFFEDRKRAIGEMLRVLVPGGRLAVAVWDALESMPAYARETALLEEMIGPAVAGPLRGPYALGNREELAALFADAGMATAQITTHSGTAVFPSVRTMVEADLRGWLPLMGVTLSEARIAAVLDEAERALRSYVTPEGRVKFHLSVHFVTASKAA